MCMQRMANKYGMSFFEVSVRNRINVDAPFLHLTRKILAAGEFRYRHDSDSRECVNCHAPSEARCKCTERV